MNFIILVVNRKSDFLHKDRSTFAGRCPGSSHVAPDSLTSLTVGCNILSHTIRAVWSPDHRSDYSDCWPHVKLFTLYLSHSTVLPVFMSRALTFTLWEWTPPPSRVEQAAVLRSHKLLVQILHSSGWNVQFRAMQLSKHSYKQTSDRRQRCFCMRPKVSSSCSIHS